MIGIIGAMVEEITEIKKLMTEIEEIQYHGMTFYKGLLSNKEVILAQSGIGKVNAGIVTTTLIIEYKVDGIINIGTAGGLKDYEEVLDVVISDVVAYHDFEIDSPNWAKNLTDYKMCFKPDLKYVEMIKQVIEKDSRVWVGPIVSGDVFVSKDEQVNKIIREFPEALCAEMESASVGHACTIFNVPFVIIRSLSDITIKEGNELDFDTYLVKASKRSALWCQKFMEIYQ